MVKKMKRKSISYKHRERNYEDLSYAIHLQDLQPF